MKERDGEEVDHHPHAYEYEVETVVLLKPAEDAVRTFWLAKVVALGEDSNEGEYQVYWMHTNKDYGLYTYDQDAQGRPSMDWVYEQSVQDSVVVCRKG